MWKCDLPVATWKQVYIAARGGTSHTGRHSRYNSDLVSLQSGNIKVTNAQEDDFCETTGDFRYLMGAFQCPSLPCLIQAGVETIWECMEKCSHKADEKSDLLPSPPSKDTGQDGQGRASLDEFVSEDAPTGWYFLRILCCLLDCAFSNLQ